jgi:hypothetical protein
MASTFLSHSTKGDPKMDDKERSANEMFVRVQNFGAARVADFPAGSIGDELFASVRAAVADFDKHSAGQSSGASDARRGTSIKDGARAALSDDLDQMSRTARAMAFKIDGLDEKFRLPRYLNDQKLLETARAFAADAVAFKDAFIRYGMPADFLEDLAADIADFEAASHSQNLGIENQVTATAGVNTARQQGMNAVRQLDAVVRNKYRDDPTTLAAWERARHIERAKRSKKDTSPPTTPAAP